MKSKALNIMLIFGIAAIVVFGCGEKEASASVEPTVTEEESASGEVLSFALLNESITMECGTPFDEDVSKYVKAANIENISMKLVASPAIHEFEDLVIVGAGEEEVEFTDNVTQDTIIMKVVYEDTTPPIIEFLNGNNLTTYGLVVKENIEVDSKNFTVSPAEYKIEKNIFLEEDTKDLQINYVYVPNYIYHISEGKLLADEMGSEFIGYKGWNKNSFINIEDFSPPYDIKFASTNSNYIDFRENYTEIGEYEDEIIITDAGGYTSKAKFSIKVVEDVTPLTRESYNRETAFHEAGLLDKLMADYESKEEQ